MPTRNLADDALDAIINRGNLDTDLARLADLARQLLARGAQVERVDWDAVDVAEHPELFEPRTDRNPLPWPLEPHNRPTIATDWWRPCTLVTSESTQAYVQRWAEDLLDCEHHPGMIVRRVRVLFQLASLPGCNSEPASQRVAVGPGAIYLPAQFARRPR